MTEKDEKDETEMMQDKLGINKEREEEILCILKDILHEERGKSVIIKTIMDHPDLIENEKLFLIYAFGGFMQKAQIKTDSSNKMMKTAYIMEEYMASRQHTPQEVLAITELIKTSALLNLVIPKKITKSIPLEVIEKLKEKLKNIEKDPEGFLKNPEIFA